MAVISAAIAAIAAVSFATTATAVATVATAVVAVSAAIGTLGLAVTAVGLITKNQDLLKAGKIMGYVGLAGGLAGGAIGGFGAMANGTGTFLEGAAGAYSGAAGHMSEAWDKGVGSWFSSGTAKEVVGSVDTVIDPATGNIIPSHQVYNGDGLGPLNPVSQAPEAALDAGQTATTLGQNGPIPTDAAGLASQTPQGATAQAITAPTGAAGPTGPVGYTVPSADQAIAQSQGAIQQTLAGGPLAPSGLVDTAGSSLSVVDKVAKAWADMPDYMKYSLMSTGGQGMAGLASGYFAGASAEERLEFDKLINAQRQGQVDLLNRNAAYAPSVRFNGPVAQTGLLNTARRRA